jgi:hypothetical protein
LTLYRAKRDRIREQRQRGDITPQEAARQIRAMTDDLFGRRGNRIPVVPKPERP